MMQFIQTSNNLAGDLSLDNILERVIVNQEIVTIERPDGGSVSLIATEELNSIMETMHLLSSPRNAIRLLNALERAQNATVAPQAVEELYQKYGLTPE